MNNHVTFFVAGEPAPQGSKTGRVVNGRVVMFEASAKVKPWRKAVVEAAQQYAGMIDGEPVEVTLSFNMVKPKTSKRLFPTVKPDLDKLIRSTLDGLTTSGIYPDDSHVVAIGAAKHYAEPNGCWITVGKANV